MIMTTAYTDAIFIWHRGRYVRFALTGIHFVEARKNYSKLFTASGDVLVLASLKRFEELLPPDSFAASTGCASSR